MTTSQAPLIKVCNSTIETPQGKHRQMPKLNKVLGLVRVSLTRKIAINCPN
jgi:hypothetical protein